MPISPRSTSRFQDSQPILTREGDPTYGIAKKFRFLDKNNLNDDEIGVIVIDADNAGRPDRLADELYGNSMLHWILIMFNKVDNPLNWPLNGQVVEYPLQETVSAEI